MWKFALALIAISASADSFSMVQYFRHQDDATIGLVSYLVGGVFVVLLLALFALWVKGRRNKHQAIRSQQALLQQQILVNTFSAGRVHIDRHGVVTYINAAAATLMRVKAEKALGQTVGQLFTLPEDHPLASVHQQNKSISTQIDLPGRVHLAIKSSKPEAELTDIAAVIAINDVSLQQREIDQLQSELSRYQQFHQQLEIADVTFNLKTKLSELSDGAARLLGTSETSIKLGDKIETNQSGWSQFVQALQKGQTADVILQLKTESGSRAFRLLGLPLDGEVCTIMLCCDQKLQQSRNLAHHSQLVNKSLLAASSNALLLLDEQGRVEACNGEFERLFGLSQTHVTGQLLTEISALPAACRKLSVTTPMTTQTGLSSPLSITRPNQPEKKVKLSQYGFRDERGTPRGSVLQFTDITALCIAEADAKQHAARFSALLDSSPLGTLILGNQGQVKLVNGTLAAHPVLHVLADGKSAITSLLKSREDNDVIRQAMEQGQGVSLARCELQLDSSENILCGLHIMPLDATGSDFVCWIQDLTEQEDTQRQFNALLEHSLTPAGIFTETGFEKLNDAATALFALDTEQLQGLYPYSEKLNRNATEAASLQSRMISHMQTGKMLQLPWTHEVKGQTIPCQALYIPLIKQGKWQKTLCMWLDLRELQRAKLEQQKVLAEKSRVEQRLRDKQNQLESSQNLLESQHQALAEAQQQQSTIAGEMDQLQQAHRQALQNQSELQTALTDSQQQIAKTEDALQQSIEERAKLQQELQQQAEKVGSLEKQRADIADAMQASEKRLADTQQGLLDAEQQIAELNDARTDEQQRLEKLHQQMAQQQQQSQSKQAALALAEQQIHSLNSRLSAAEKNSESLQQQLVNLRKASDLAAKEKTQVQSAFQQAQQQLESQMTEHQRLQQKLTELEALAREKEEALLQNDGHWQQQKAQYEQQQAALAIQLDEARQELQYAQSERHSAQQQLEQVLSQAQDAQQQLKENERKAAQQLAERTTQLETLKIDLQRAEQQAADAEQQRDLVAEQMAEEQQRLRELLEQAQSAHAEVTEAAKATQQDASLTKQQLEQARQTSDQELAQHHQEIVRLKAALADVEQQSQQQQAEGSQRQQQLQQTQQKMQDALRLAQQELEDATASRQQISQQLAQAQQEADNVKQQLAEREQQAADLLEQHSKEIDKLTGSLSALQQQANQERQALASSDEQWQQQQQAMLVQRETLENSLQQAQQRQQAFEQQVQQQAQALANAEQDAQQRAAEEARLQTALVEQQTASDTLQKALTQAESEQHKLTEQLAEQAKQIEQKEHQISDLERTAEQLENKLAEVEKAHSASIEQLAEQDRNQTGLSAQLVELQKQLAASQKALSEKEAALEQPQQSHATNPAQTTSKSKDEALPDYATLPLPDSPADWFELLPYLQKQTTQQPVAVLLSSLLARFEQIIALVEQALDGQNVTLLNQQAKALDSLAKDIDSVPLTDMAFQLAEAARRKDLDSLEIFWPSVKNAIQITLRVIHSQVHS